MKQETRTRSIVRSIIWRLIGVAVLAIITFAFTRSWIQTTLITLVHHTAFLIIYYLHERAWLRVPETRICGKKRAIARCFTYEIILGHCILGLISLIFTGSWTTVTLITITYIENKLWIYALYDWFWSKIKWGRET